MVEYQDIINQDKPRCRENGAYGNPFFLPGCFPRYLVKRGCLPIMMHDETRFRFFNRDIHPFSNLFFRVPLAQGLGISKEHEPGPFSFFFSFYFSAPASSSSSSSSSANVKIKSHSCFVTLDTLSRDCFSTCMPAKTPPGCLYELSSFKEMMPGNLCLNSKWTTDHFGASGVDLAS